MVVTVIDTRMDSVTVQKGKTMSSYFRDKKVSVISGLAITNKTMAIVKSVNYNANKLYKVMLAIESLSKRVSALEERKDDER